jgi:hypothetical protein
VSSLTLERLSVEQLQAENGAVLPTKEVLSVPLLDLNVDVNLALDLAAPIDLAVAGNANVVLPINASVSANALSALSAAEAGSSQGVLLDQVISGDAIAHGNQTSAIDQTGDGGTSGAEPSVASLGAPADHAGTTGDAVPTTTAGDQPAAHTTPPNAVGGQPASGSGQPAAAASQPAARIPVSRRRQRPSLPPWIPPSRLPAPISLPST